MRKKYEEWVTDEKLTLLRGWACDGLTDEQIADNMHIGVRTLYTWKKEHQQIRQALKTGAREADYAVENALYKKALSGDVAACIFWLKNRNPEKWRDKPEQKTNGNDLPQIVDDLSED